MNGALRRRPVLAWAFYDWANSAFATTVMAGFFPVFFKQHWNLGVPVTESTFRLGVTSGIASALIALVAIANGALLFMVMASRATYGLAEGGMTLTSLEPGLEESGCLIAKLPDVVAKVKALRDEVVAGTVKVADPMQLAK